MAAAGLTAELNSPVIGIVSRFAAQKGFDLIGQIVDRLALEDILLIVLGSGDKLYEEMFLRLARRVPGKVSVRVAYDNAFAHKIEAGADMFLMPSRYEPSGLTQLYSLKYGTIPVVRATGGLKDTIEEFDPATGKGNGFCFKPYEASAFLAAVNRALAVFQNKNQWKTLMTNAMTADYSWSRSASEYLNLYRRLLKE